jgi:hypothetical protein
MLAQRAVGSLERAAFAILLADGEPNHGAAAGLLAAASTLTNEALDRSARERRRRFPAPREPFGESLRH